MDVRTLQEEMRRLLSIVDGWDSPVKMSEIERDLVLEKLRALYEAVRFFELPAAETEEDETPVEIDLGVDFSVETLSLGEPLAGDAASGLELKPEEAIFPEPEVESVPETEPTPEVLPEPEVEQEPQPAEESAAEQKPAEAEASPVVAPTLFGLEPNEELLRHRQKQRVIMSLYHNEPVHSEAGTVADNVQNRSESTPESTHLAAYAAEPSEEDPFGEDDPFVEISIEKSVGDAAPGAVLGDVINHDRQTLADTIAPRRDRTSDLGYSEPVGDLRRAIGLNDRFLLVRDLFDGDGEACDAALEALNGFDSLDDCMIYIAENYVWNPNSDGVKFLMELIERKFA